MGIAYLLAGCYQPDVKDCTVTCNSPSDCTAGQVCHDGWCAMPDKSCKDKDQGVALDATGDGNAGCAVSCGAGSCVDGVCVIDCSAPWSCQNDVQCPAGASCRVVCGYHACAKHIVEGMATSLEVQCSGDYACGDEIQCNTRRCSVACTGISSCKVRTKCDNACACDVSCTGSSACGENSVCPAAACVSGKGCSSQPAGCNSCP